MQKQIEELIFECVRSVGTVLRCSNDGTIESLRDDAGSEEGATMGS